jgi:DNA-binding MurR/RpiR family transcriptional regulator
MRAVRDELSANEKKIADFILKNSALIRDYSSQNLAASVGVSQSSIVKFAQKLNYRGFTDLKLAIHESVVISENGDFAVDQASAGDERPDSIVAQIYNIKNEALLTTMELNDEQRLLAAVKLLEDSQRIQVLGLGSGSLVADNFASKLVQLGKSVNAEKDTYIQVSNMATLGPDDTVVVISLTGQSARMIQMMRQAKNAGVSIISLTNYSANPIRALAGIQLFSVSREGDFEIPQVISSTSQQHVVDLLFSLMLKRNKKARDSLALSRKAVEQF